MLVLADNDIILKLAACDLLGAVLASEDVYINPAARWSLPSQAAKRGDESVLRITAFLTEAHDIDWVDPLAELELFQDTFGIDPGEAVLFAAAAKRFECRLLTGDKVSLKALARSKACELVAERIAGRVICFEQTVLQCIDSHGFDNVLVTVFPNRDCDTALRAIFGSGLTATEESVRAGLNSYISDLRRQTGSLLSDP